MTLTSTDLPVFDDATLRRIIEQFFLSSFNAIVITAPEPGYPILYANPAFCRMTGYSLEELRGQSPRILQGEKSNRRVLQRLHEDLQAGRDFHGATINYRKNGEPYPVEWNISPITDDNGRTTHFISVQKDLSNLKQVMSRLKSTHLHFRRFLGELSQSRAGAGLEPALQQRMDELTGELLDNARLYTPALRSDDNVALFGETEFFDCSGDMNGALGEPIERQHISAQEYARQHRFSDTDISELQVIIRETLEQLDLVEYSADRTAYVQIVAANLQEMANMIFYLEDFVGISSVLAEVATHTLRHAERNWPEFLFDTFRALVHDIQSWVDVVFVARTAADIHELDASIISSAKQLLVFLP